MDDCNCPLVTTAELKALLNSENAQEKEQAIACLLALLTSRDERARARGYELFEEGINDALFCSCLNYRSLVRGFTHPLLQVVTRAVETWAISTEIAETQSDPSCGSRQP